MCRIGGGPSVQTTEFSGVNMGFRGTAVETGETPCDWRGSRVAGYREVTYRLFARLTKLRWDRSISKGFRGK
jgi:hypothetical protein